MIRAIWLIFSFLFLCNPLLGTDKLLLKSPHFEKLLRAGGIRGPLTKDTILTYTQQHWIATRSGLKGIERCDLKDTPQQQKIRAKVIRCLDKMHFFEASVPSRHNYRYGICLGAFLPSVRERLFQLVDAWKKGVRFDSLIFLCGERSLRKGIGEKDDLAALCDRALSPLPFKSNWQLPVEAPYEQEIDMARLVWDQVEIPEEMRIALEGHVLFVNAPKGENAARASTKDAYRHWLESCKPVPGAVLASSSPVVCHYQHLVGGNLLGPDYPLETIAPATDPSHWQVAVLLDTVAKCLVEILQQKSKSF